MLGQGGPKQSIDTSGDAEEEDGGYWDCLVWPVLSKESSNNRSWACKLSGYTAI